MFNGEDSHCINDTKKKTQKIKKILKFEAELGSQVHNSTFVHEENFRKRSFTCGPNEALVESKPFGMHRLSECPLLAS